MEQSMSDMSTVSLPDYPELNNFRGRSLTEEQQAKLLRLVERLRPYHENRVRLADMTPERQKEWLLLLKEMGHDGEAEPSDSWVQVDDGFYGAIGLLDQLGASLTPPAVVGVRRTEEEKLCEVLATQTQTRYHGRITSSFSVNGITWTLPHRRDSDHTAALRDCCKAAFHALDKTTAANGSEGVPAWKTVVGVLPIVADKVAALTEREPPSPPSNAQDDGAARRYVETVVTWCDPTGKKSFVAEAPSPADKAGQMRAAIARERNLQRIMRNGLHQDNFNWQTGVDRLWDLWDELFSEVVPEPAPPDKPRCSSYAEAKKAVLALQDALPKGVRGRQGPLDGDCNEGDETSELDEREQAILAVLLKGQHIGERRATSRRKTAKMIDPEDSPASFNHSFATLVEKKLLNSKTGPKGGVWLTTDGEALAKGLPVATKS
jgi:hypothetical protein